MRLAVLNIISQRISIVRILLGLFALYFFYFYSSLLDTIFQIRDPNHSGLFNFLQNFDVGVVKIVMQACLITACIACVFFILNRGVKYCAVIIWIVYTLSYNLVTCINQPHISYFLFAIITFAFFGQDEIENRIASKKYFKFPLLSVLQVIYLLQMTVSGFSKLLLYEWRSGDILRVMSKVYDPTPGVLLLGNLPDGLLQLLTWAVLIFECGAFLYLFVPKLRLPLWLSHFVMYLGIMALVPHATHVAFVMLMFIIFIFDPQILPTRLRNESLVETN